MRSYATSYFYFQEGLSPRFHKLDIDSLESIQRFRDYLKSTYGGLDVLVNNAAVAYKVYLPYLVIMILFVKII